MLKPKVMIPYHKAVKLLQEGDVLLFRKGSWYTRFIKSAGWTKYCHVGIASKPNGMWEIIQFHGSTGGATQNLALMAKSDALFIDVYRPSPHQDRYVMDPTTLEVIPTTREFNGRAVTNVMRKLTGLPYGWRRIWWLMKRRLVIWNLFFNKVDLITDEDNNTIVYPVCSTAVAYAFHQAGFGLLHNKSSEFYEPGDLALSTNLNELFTICWDIEKDKDFLP